jgi:hypothetical protein
MKFYTQGLMNEKLKFSLLSIKRNRYYIANGIDADVTLMWIESSYSKGSRAFPCLIRERDTLLTYSQGYTPDSAEMNQALIDRWNQLITPESVHERYSVESVDEELFYRKYNELRRKAAD